MRHEWNASPRRSARGLASVVLAGALLGTAACAGGGAGGGDSAGGPSVAPGASKADYAEALADMDPVELTMQSSGAKGGSASRRWEAYAAAVEDWSDGKITFEIVYGNAVAGSLETVDALSDGRLGITTVLGMYEPDRHPSSNALVDLMTEIDPSTVGGTLQGNAAMLEAGFEIPEIREEYEERGVHLLLPMFAGDSIDLMCTSPGSSLADLNGRQARIGASSQVQQVEALGMSPVSLPFTEIFEGLQRGIIDCAVTSLTVADLGGLVPVAKHLVVDTAVGWGRVPFGVGVDVAIWADLPLAAQQLLHDRLDVLIEEQLLAAWDAAVDALNLANEEGGSVSQLDPDAREALQDANEQVRSDAGEKLAGEGDAAVQQVSDLATSWWEIVTNELGYDGSVGYDDFSTWYSENPVDLGPYIERIRTEVLDKYRPGN